MMTLRYQIQQMLKYSDFKTAEAVEEAVHRVLEESWPDSGLDESEWLSVELLANGGLARLSAEDEGISLEVRSGKDSGVISLSCAAARQLSRLLEALVEKEET